MDCSQIEREEIIEKYLAGRLDRAGQEEFEAHYFGCSNCLAKLQVSRLLQEKLWEKGAAILPQTEEPRRLRIGRRVWIVSAAVALIAAGAVLWWQFRGPDRAPVGTKETPSSLIMLARFEPPAYIPPALRGAEDEATERFRLGMEHYQDGHYGESIPYLRAAAGSDPQRASTRFFLGICLLMTEQTNAGIEELQKAVALGESAYLEEAHFYLAKAWLAKGSTRAAKEELNWVLEKGSNLKEEAAEILAQLK
jgi:tetratricopeptide (TPR) repeat protein